MEDGEAEVDEKTFASPIPSKEKEVGLKTPITKVQPKVSPSLPTDAKKQSLEKMKQDIIGMSKLFK